ncbi:MAG TPA: BREX-2 system phosphatase PglZ [Actinocrinis sp.]|nr:BREX-2 system phosphatase PglZ [Actinocrinis sp.]
MPAAIAAPESAPPRVTQGILASLVRRELERKAQQANPPRLILVYASHAPDTDGGARFTVTANGKRHQVAVVDCGTVLAIADAWQQFQADIATTTAGTPHVLVVTTSVPDEAIGIGLRAYAARNRTITVDTSELVKEQFGVRELDWRLAQEQWLLDALLAAEPTGGWAGAGWKPATALLTRDTAVTALLDTRISLGTGEHDGGAPDSGALLEWSLSRDPTRYAALPQDERDGMSAWLADASGPAAPIVLRLAASGQAADAVPLGLLCTALSDPDAGGDALLVIGGLFGAGAPSLEVLRSYAAAAEGAVLRWVQAATGSGERAREHRQRVLGVIRRAETIAAGYPQLAKALLSSPLLPAGFTKRLVAFAGTLQHANPRDDAALVAIQQAFNTLAAHHLAALNPERIAPAEMALRLVGWLHAEPAPNVGTASDSGSGSGSDSRPGAGNADCDAQVTVPGALRRHATTLAWVDRALTTLYHGDPHAEHDRSSAERVAAGYQRVYQLAYTRRSAEDVRFATVLQHWAANATSRSSGGALLIEEVLPKVALTLANATGLSPLVLVLDGMSGAVAAQLGAALTKRNLWTEITATAPQAAAIEQNPDTPSPQAAATRLCAVAVIPSVTQYSRASLLTAALGAGGQQEEKAGFAQFWQRQGHEPAALFHKREITDDQAGGRLNPALAAALAQDGVVGVVLNDVDDALDKGARGDATRWDLDHVAHLRTLLDAASSYGRPVLLVSDHGHVLDRSSLDATPTKTSSSVKNPRYRSADGEPARPGEIELAGPRVLDCGGQLIAACVEDLRYTARRAGYHGGATLAEMTVPVLVFLPNDVAVPDGWIALTPRQTTPAWWHTSTAETGGAGARDAATLGALGRGEAVPSPAAHAAAVEPSRSTTPRRAATKPPQEEALFPITAADATAQPHAPAEAPSSQSEPSPSSDAASSPTTLGAAIVASQTYAEQKRFVRKMKDEEVAKAVDALHAADGTLPAAVLAETVGRSGAAFDGFVANLERLLNVDQYAVVSRIDAGRTISLNVRLLGDQFGVG